MPRKKRVDNTSEQAERLDSKIRLDGVGEDQAVKELVDGTFEKASNTDAFNIALALQDLIRGQNSILSNQKAQGEELTRLKAKMDKYDEAEKAWKDDRANFLAKVEERAEALRIDSPAQKAELIAKEAQNIQNAIAAKRAENTLGKARFDYILSTQPVEIVVSPGVPSTINDNGVQRHVMSPEVIKIKHRKWVLQPGVPTEVPKLVADEFQQRQKSRQEIYERKALLNATAPKENMLVAQKWGEINKKYGSGGDEFRGDSR